MEVDGLFRSAGVRVVVACGLAWMGWGLSALKAAGLTGKAPDGSSAITQLIATLTSNWEWLIGTGIGLVLMLIAGMMMFGSQRAPDHLFRVIGGIMLILIVIPAVLA
jgi:hypothetical protein